MNTITISTTQVPVIHYKDVPVITTERLSDLYGASQDRIRKNYSRNADRFIEGKHFFKLVGKELLDFVRDFKACTNKARNLMLWTERGAARHAKMLETDKAWEVFEALEDVYFSNVRSNVKSIPFMPSPEKTAYREHPDYAYAREQLSSLYDWSQRALPPRVHEDFYDVLKELDRSLIRGWTEIDESLICLIKAMGMLRRWKRAH